MKEDFKFFLFIGIITLIGFTLVFTYFLFFFETEEGNKINFSPNEFPDDNPLKIKKTIDNSTPNSETNLESNNKEISSEKTKGNEEPESSGIARGCIMERISFALKDFNSNSNCEEFNNEICIKKTINCTVLTENLDNSIGGLFRIRIAFLENNIKFQETIKEKQLSPKESTTLSAFMEIESNGTDGRANKVISCDFNSIEIPQREVCY